MTAGPSLRRDPPSFVYPGADPVPASRRAASDIEGVGQHYGRVLRDIGIYTIGDLIAAPAERIATYLDLPAAIVHNWHAMAELIDVRGVSPEFAELLLRCGIRSARELADNDPETLLARILLTSADRMVRVQGLPLGQQHVEAWISEARRTATVPLASTPDPVSPTTS